MHIIISSSTAVDGDGYDIADLPIPIFQHNYITIIIITEHCLYAWNTHQYTYADMQTHIHTHVCKSVFVFMEHDRMCLRIDTDKYTDDDKKSSSSYSDYQTK